MFAALIHVWFQATCWLSLSGNYACERRYDLQPILIGNRHCISVQWQELLPSAAQTSRSLWIINPDPQQQRPCLKKQYIILHSGERLQMINWLHNTHYKRRRANSPPLMCFAVCLSGLSSAGRLLLEMTHCDVSLRTNKHMSSGECATAFYMCFKCKSWMRASAHGRKKLRHPVMEKAARRGINSAGVYQIKAAAVFSLFAYPRRC